MQNLPNLPGYIFYSLQHFTTKLRNFSKRGMLFQAMVIFLPISIFFKVLSERGKVHSYSLFMQEGEGLVITSDFPQCYF